MKSNRSGYLLVLVATLLGLASGFSKIPSLYSTADIISELFMNFLKMISLPIVFLSITSTITGMKNLKEMRFLGGKILRYTLLTTLIAATSALLIFKLINPTASDLTLHASAEPASGSLYLSAIKNIIPSNFFKAFIENNVIGVAFTAVVLSISIVLLPEESKKPLHNFFSSLFAAVLKITHFIITLLPIGIWAFMTLFVRDISQNSSQIKTLLLYITCIVSANLFQGVVVLPALLKMKRISPLKIAKGMFPALLLAFFSKSSSATLPVTMKCAEDNLGISRRVSSFSFPLCSVINMNACAGFILITVLFVSMSHGMTFSWIDLVAWIFLATFAAIGNAGVPMGCYFLTSAFITSMDLPLYTMGIILPIYTILDMLETSINIWSDSCITSVVDKELKGAEEFAISLSTAKKEMS